MQIVIDIPKCWFDDMVREEFCEVDELCAVIQHGIVLPKHHGDLKDVNKIKEEAIDMSQWGSDAAYGVWVEDIDEAPTIIPATERR